MHDARNIPSIGIVCVVVLGGIQISSSEFVARKSVWKQMQSETRFLAQLCTFKWIERAIKEVTYFHKSTFRRFWLITAEERGLCLLPGNDVTFDSKGLSAKWRRCYFSFPCSFVCLRKPLDRLYFLLCAQQIRLFAERSIRAPLREDDTAEMEYYRTPSGRI